jgi:hypothetical protein
LPIPTQLLFLFASGLLVALAARADLRGSPKPSALSHAFGAYLLYAGLVVVPASLYLYIFHGDWYLLYLVDSQHVPSALVLLGCLLELGLGAAGFLLGAAFVRNQREPWAGAMIGIAASLGGAAIPVVQGRLSVVGSYAQYHGDFGLVPFGGALLFGVVGMTFWCLSGLALLAYRVGLGARRS